MTRHYLDILAEVIRDNWDCPALTDYSLLQGEGGNEYTYGQMYEKIQKLCQLFTQLGLRPGDHIALCGANSANWAVAYLAIAAYQGVSVTMNHAQLPQDIVDCIGYGDAKVLFVDDDIWAEIKAHTLSSLCVISLEKFSLMSKEKSLQLSIKPQESSDSTFETGNIDDLAQICFTAGSTGKPKGVMLSFGNISNNIQNSMEALPAVHRKKYISTLPLSHAYGLMGDLLFQMPHANQIIYFKDCSVIDTIDAFNQCKPAYWMTIPLLFEKILPHLNNDSIQACKQIFIGGAVANRQLEAQLLAKGIHLSVGYGMTETGPLICATIFTHYRQGSVGRVVSGMEARISPEGEILVRGENVMLGYYKDEEATREKIDADGWLHTGDRGHLDEDGYLYVEGRLNQDMIVLPSGENIHPENIEAIINAVPHVVESLVRASDGKLIALVRKDVAVPPAQAIAERNALLAKVNPQLPSFSQLFGIEFITKPLQRTEKQTIKRYMYQ